MHCIFWVVEWPVGHIAQPPSLSATVVLLNTRFFIIFRQVCSSDCICLGMYQPILSSIYLGILHALHLYSIICFTINTTVKKQLKCSSFIYLKLIAMMFDNVRSIVETDIDTPCQ